MRPTKNALQKLVANVLTSRAQWLRKLLDPRRDIDAECGHPDCLDVDDYKRLFQRGDIARRVVSVLPEESWNDSPIVFETDDESETEFEKAWALLNVENAMLSFLERIDMLSGIGRFGILLLGLDDGEDLNKPAQGINEKGEVIGGVERKLLYLRAFDEGLVDVATLVTDIKNPRYGQPQTYTVQFSDTTAGEKATQTTTIHWTRVVHVADNRTDSEVYGAPRMEAVVNRILDIKKIAGGSGEMFWKGGFPGLSLEAQQGLEEEIEFDKEATIKELDAYMNGLQRYIALQGMQAKTLSPNIADPGSHLEVQLKLIATAMGVPWRILIGSEAAQLASEQDSRSWAKRLTRRRTRYITPFIIRPFIDRLIAFGVLPKVEKYSIHWPDPANPSDKDKADIAEKRTNALSKYVQTGADVLMPPFHFLTLVLGMTDEEAISVTAGLDNGELPEPPAPVAPPAGAPAGRGTTPAARPAPAGRNGA